MRKVSRILKFNTDGRTDFMTPETAVAMMLAMSSRPSEERPTSLVYTDSDPDYVPPETVLSGETFDTVTEVYQDRAEVYGIGVTGKDTSSETVTRLIFPDGGYITLVNW